ncbi:MAG: glycoside hydrolase family 43 protein, partial [Sphingomonadales bacterium]
MPRISWLVAAFGMINAAPLGAAPAARFDFVSYRALDPAPATPANSYRNPILPGFQPDPSIVRVGSDFYLVTSTFSWFPGLPIYHSTDLVNWRLTGHAIDRAGQLDFGGRRGNEALFAPAIEHHGGKFWIVNTCIECGGNYVITADKAEGPWTEPVWLDFGGIDPSLVFGGDGRAWIAYNDAPPGEPLYEGHRAIWLQEFDPVAMRMKPARTLLVNGGLALKDKPVWAEGPHIYRHDGWYYLMAAEGGTADQHSETI